MGLESVKNIYASFVNGLVRLQHPFLFSIRLYWGWQFFEAGKGKFGNIDRTIGFFTNLGIPFPTFNTFLVAGTEMIGGLLLLLGLCSRLVSVPLVITMLVAYLTADLEAIKAIFSDPDLFVKAAPFSFLLTTLVVLLFGPGIFSLDRIIQTRFSCKNRKS